MPLDPANNLAETELTASVSDTTTTLPVADASVFPDADTEGAFNVLVWDSEANINPSDAPDAEFVRVTSVDTTADELTVERGQEDTTASAKASGSTVTDTWSVKDRDDIDAGIAGKADDPHAHTDTDDGGAPLGRVPGQSEFESTLEDEGVSKVHNGVVYAGHPDFNTLEDAAIFATNNGHFAVGLEPNTAYSGISESADVRVDIIGHGVAGRHPSLGASTFSNPVTLSGLDIDSATAINGAYSKLANITISDTLTINADECSVIGATQFILSSHEIVVEGDQNLIIAPGGNVTDNGTGNNIITT